MTHNSCQMEDAWFNIKMSANPCVVESVFVVNRETNSACWGRIIGSDIFVGNDANPKNNSACNVHPTTSGVFQCGGLIGTYLGIYKQSTPSDCLNISQIRAYSYRLNGYENYALNFSSPSCESSGILPTVFSNGLLIEDLCVKYSIFVLGQPSYIEVRFDVARFIQTVTIVGNAVNDFEKAKNWIVKVGNGAGMSLINSGKEVGRYTTDQDRFGKEIIVRLLGHSVTIYRTDYDLQLKGFLLTTTATDCTDQFDWSGTFDFPTLIPIGATAKSFTGPVMAAVSDCAVSYQQATLQGGTSLPSFISHNVNARTLSMTVDATTPVGIYVVSVMALINDKIAELRSSEWLHSFQIVKSTSISLDQTSLSVEYEVGVAKTFNLPLVTCSPIEAELNVVYSASEAPSWLSFLPGAQGSFASDSVQGSMTFQVTATDSISGLSQQFSMTIYSCNQVSLTLTPSSVSVSILGPSVQVTGSMTSVNALCGTYSLTAVASTNFAIKASGWMLAINSPNIANALLGTYSSAISLKRDSLPDHKTSTPLSIKVTECMVTSLTWSTQPQPFSHKVGIDLPRVQTTFASQSSPNCLKKVSFSLYPHPAFITLKQTAFTAGSIEMTSAVSSTDQQTTRLTLTATVDGVQAPPSSFLMTITDPAFQCEISMISDVISPQTIPGNLVYVLRSKSVVYELPTYSFAPSNCKQSLSITLENVSPGVPSPTTYPKFLKYDTAKNTVTLSGDSFSEANKDFKFRVVATTANGRVKNSKFKFVISTLFLNSAPSFGGDVLLQVVSVGQPASWKLPAVSDPEGDNITVRAEIDAANAWLTFDGSEFKFASDKVKKEDAGTITVLVSATDQYGAKTTVKQVIQVESEENGNNVGQTISADLNSQDTLAMPVYLQQILEKLGLLGSQGSQEKDTKAIKKAQAVPLALETKSMSRSGLLSLEFTRAVQIDFSLLATGQTDSRTLQSNTTESEEELKLQVFGAIKKAINITFESTQDSEAELQSFEVTQFNDAREVQLQINFNEPLLVSANSQISSEVKKDKLTVRISDFSLFLDPLTSKPLKTDATPLVLAVPKQVPVSFTENVQSLVESTAYAVKTVVPGTIVLNVFMGLGLKKLWTAINILQFITHTQLWKISPPANLEIFFDQASFFAKGDWIPKDLVLKKLKVILNDKQSQQTAFLIAASVILLVFSVVVILLALALKKYSTHRYSQKVIEACENFKKQIFFNGIIRMTLQCYLDFAISTSLALNINGQKSKAKVAFSEFMLNKVAFSATLFFIILLLPAVYFILLKKNFPVMHDQKVQELFGTLFLGGTLKRFDAVLFNVEFLVRRALFAMVAVFIGTRTVGPTLICIVVLGTLHSVFLMTTRPHTPWKRRFELIGECLLLYCFFGVMLCELETNPFVKYSFGWFSVASVIILVLAHLVNMMTDSVKTLFRKAKMYVTKKCREYKRKEVEEKRQAEQFATNQETQRKQLKRQADDEQSRVAQLEEIKEENKESSECSEEESDQQHSQLPQDKQIDLELNADRDGRIMKQANQEETPLPITSNEINKTHLPEEYQQEAMDGIPPPAINKQSEDIFVTKANLQTTRWGAFIRKNADVSPAQTEQQGKQDSQAHIKGVLWEPADVFNTEPYKAKQVRLFEEQKMDSGRKLLAGAIPRVGTYNSSKILNQTVQPANQRADKRPVFSNLVDYKEPRPRNLPARLVAELPINLTVQRLYDQNDGLMAKQPKATTRDMSPQPAPFASAIYKELIPFKAKRFAPVLQNNKAKIIAEALTSNRKEEDTEVLQEF